MSFFLSLSPLPACVVDHFQTKKREKERKKGLERRILGVDMSSKYVMYSQTPRTQVLNSNSICLEKKESILFVFMRNEIISGRHSIILGY